MGRYKVTVTISRRCAGSEEVTIDGTEQDAVDAMMDLIEGMGVETSIEPDICVCGCMTTHQCAHCDYCGKIR